MTDTKTTPWQPIATRMISALAGALSGLFAGVGLAFGLYSLTTAAPHWLGKEIIGLPICWCLAGFFRRLS